MRNLTRLGRGIGVELAIITAALLFIFFTGCDKRSGAPTGLVTNYPLMHPVSDASLVDELRRQYKEDAARLVLRVIRENNWPAIDEVELPGGLVNSLYYALLHLRNSKLPARDSVIEMYNIRTFKAPYMDEVILAVDSTVEWLRPWREGKRFTGNLEVDHLMILYDLRVTRYYALKFGGHLVELKSSRLLNTYALADEFDKVDDVIAADANGGIGDGNDIEAKVKDGSWELEYSLGWGDCPSGCTLRHYWRFQIKVNGNVEFQGSYGDPVL